MGTRVGWVAGLVVPAVVMAACSGGSGSQNDGGGAGTAADGGSGGSAAAGGASTGGVGGGAPTGGSGGIGGTAGSATGGNGGVGGSGGGAGAGGAAGAGGTSGSSGTGGASGSSGMAGSSGMSGTGGIAGSLGTGGSSGSAGGGGMAGTGGASGTCGAIATFEDGLTPTRELHVAESGNDSTGDGSSGNPFASIERATDDATPGTAIRVHAGTYAGGDFITDLAGTASDPIWIGGAPGEARPIIEGGGESLHLARVRYLVLHDLEARNASSNGINADDGADYGNPDATRYVVFRNLFIHDVGGTGNQDCLKLSGLDDYWVLDSIFERCGGGSSGSGVDHVGCHAGLLARNTFRQMSGNAIQNKGGAEDIEIRWNLMIDAGERAVNMGGSTGTTFFRPPLSTTSPNFEARDIRVVANVIVGSNAPIAFVGCIDCLAANNTIVDPTNWIVRILQETTTGGGYTFLEAQGGRFVNNLVYFDRSQLSTWVNIGPNTQPSTFVFENNLWYAHDDASQSTPNLPVTETNGVVGMDPQLSDPSGGVYTIPGTSPAAGAGIDLTEVTGDFDGACYASPPSIGAFEVP